MYYTRIKNTTNGNPCYLVELTPEQAQKLGARKATDNQKTYVKSLDGAYIVLDYIVQSSAIEQDLKSLTPPKPEPVKTSTKELETFAEFLTDINYHGESMAVGAYINYIKYSNNDYLDVIELLKEIIERHKQAGHLTPRLRMMRMGADAEMRTLRREDAHNPTRDVEKCTLAVDWLVDLFNNWVQEGKPNGWRE